LFGRYDFVGDAERKPPVFIRHELALAVINGFDWPVTTRGMITKKW
jgi:hypothetical protein